MNGLISVFSLYKSNKDVIVQKAELFGLCWLGDGATIHKMLKSNMLLMYGDKLPAVLSSCACTGHM